MKVMYSLDIETVQRVKAFARELTERRGMQVSQSEIVRMAIAAFRLPARPTDAPIELCECRKEAA